VKVTTPTLLLYSAVPALVKPALVVVFVRRGRYAFQSVRRSSSVCASCSITQTAVDRYDNDDVLSLQHTNLEERITLWEYEPDLVFTTKRTKYRLL